MEREKRSYLGRTCRREEENHQGLRAKRARSREPNWVKSSPEGTY